MKEKTVPAFLISLLLLLSPASAIIYKNETISELIESTAYCYGEDARDIVEHAFANYLDSWCTGTFDYPPQNCLRQLTIDNLDNKKSQITVKITPTPVGLSCPPVANPSNNRVFVKLAPNGDDGKAQTQVFDMNECWGWWCAGTSGYNVTKCPFDWDFLDSFGICREYNIISAWQALKDCPQHTFEIPADTEWLNATWGWSSENSWDVEFEIGFITLSTSKRVKVIETQYEELIKSNPTNQVMESSIGKLMQMNSSFLTIIYMIAEVVIMIFVVIVLPVGAILLIKFLWEKVTGRPLGGVKK